MLTWVQAWLHTIVYDYIDNERGQDVIVWLVILLLLWLIVSGRRLLVQ